VIAEGCTLDPGIAREKIHHLWNEFGHDIPGIRTLRLTYGQDPCAVWQQIGPFLEIAKVISDFLDERAGK
jgi:hypothetical protein